MREADNEIAFKTRVEVKEASRSEDNVEQIWDGLRLHGEGACGGLWVIHGAAKAQGDGGGIIKYGKGWRESGVCY